MTRILFLGYDPETVDFSDPALPPGMTAEKVHAGIAVAMKGFAERGWEAERWADSGASVRFDELRFCGNRSWRAPATQAHCDIRSRHQRCP